MTTPHAPQRDAATPALPRATATLISQLDDDWTHTITHATGPYVVGGLAEDGSGDGKRHRVEVTQNVESVCLRAHHGEDGRALVAVWHRRGGSGGWRLETAWRRPIGDELACKQVSATQLVAYATQSPPPDPRETQRRADELAAARAELASLRAARAAERDAWVPLTTRWNDVRVGDVVIGRDGRLWTIAERIAHPVKVEGGRFAGVTGIRATCGDAVHSTPCVRPDDEVQVLVPVPVRDALTLSRAVLGGPIMETERRTA